MGEGSDLLKLMTHKVAVYLTTPAPDKDEEAPPKPAPHRLPWSTQWFGMLPMGMQLWWGDRRSKSPAPKSEPEW